MQLINGRTPEQWAAYDRAKALGAVALAAVLLLLWLAGLGPGRAAPCCSVSESAPAAAPIASSAPPTTAAAVAAVPEAPPATAAPAPATAPPAPTPDPCAGALSVEVLFATNSSELTAEGRALLDRLAPCWRSGRFEVAGHTDSSGSDAINQPLSERRASAVVAHLVSRGLESSALTARGYGSTRPVAPNETPEDRARNRRVEFVRQ
jgi:outer membrane protein OmpA-like peptidoglycan-associated protein